MFRKNKNENKLYNLNNSIKKCVDNMIFCINMLRHTYAYITIYTYVYKNDYIQIYLF